MTHIAVDTGYRHLKVAENGYKPAVFDSVFADLIGRSAPKSNSKSAVIKYLKSNHKNNDNLVGKTWVAGYSARNINTAKSLINTQKSETAIRLALMAFQPRSGEFFREVNQLITSLPELRDTTAVEALKNAFQGSHKYEINGSEVRLSINSVEIYQEGLGTYWLAQRENLTLPNTLTGILDLGGKTANLLLIDEFGEPVEDSSASFGTGGTYELVGLIASNPDLICANKGSAIAQTTVMDALSSGSRFLGVSGIDFSQYYQEYLNQWFSGILAELETRWSRYFSRLGRVIVTGGSANLVRELIADNNYFAIPSNPQLANVVGLLYKPSNLSVVGGHQYVSAS